MRNTSYAFEGLCKARSIWPDREKTRPSLRGSERDASVRLSMPHRPQPVVPTKAAVAVPEALPESSQISSSMPASRGTPRVTRTTLV